MNLFEYLIQLDRGLKKTVILPELFNNWPISTEFSKFFNKMMCWVHSLNLQY